MAIHGRRQPDCYDYFFVTEDLVRRVAGVEVQSETAASDHQPVVLDLIPGADPTLVSRAG